MGKGDWFNDKTIDLRSKANRLFFSFYTDCHSRGCAVLSLGNTSFRPKVIRFGPTGPDALRRMLNEENREEARRISTVMPLRLVELLRCLSDGVEQNRELAQRC